MGAATGGIISLFGALFMVVVFSTSQTFDLIFAVGGYVVEFLTFVALLMLVGGSRAFSTLKWK